MKNIARFDLFLVMDTNLLDEHMETKLFWKPSQPSVMSQRERVRVFVVSHPLRLPYIYLPLGNGKDVICILYVS